jgi:hypothetical protein
MQNVKQQFSVIERLTVVAILLLVAALAVQNLLQYLTESEERTLNNAAIQYSVVKSMYAEERMRIPASMDSLPPPSPVKVQYSPIK